jgi:hypothetical protein
VVTSRGLLTKVADEPLAAVPLLFIAVAERVAWSLAGHMEIRDTELNNVAVNWARTGALSDAFQVGSGPTAHVGVLPPLIPGLVFRAFGIDTPASALVLTIFASCIIVITALVLNRLFARLGTPARYRGIAMVVICLLPLHLELEARSLRVYENGTAALLLAMMLLAVVRLDRGGTISFWHMVGLSAFTAVMLALSPPVGITAIAILGILALRRLDWAGRFRASTVLALVLVATSLPWALRNRAVLGETVWTRDNFGLEFAIGTYPKAVAPVDPQATYLARLAEVHPHQSPPAYRAMEAAGGELPYARQLGDATWAWVGSHPLQAASIWLRHLREFFFPPLWLWFHTGNPVTDMVVRMIVVNVIAGLGIVGLVSALVRRQSLFLYLLPPIVLIPLPYILAQPLVRYRYVIASLLIFLAADCLGRLTKRGEGALKPIA